MPYATTNSAVALMVLLIVALAVLFVALRYDEARQRRTKLARKQQLENQTREHETNNSHDTPHNSRPA